MVRAAIRMLFISCLVFNFNTAFADSRGSCDAALYGRLSARVHQILQSVRNAPSGVVLQRPGLPASPIALIAKPDAAAPFMYTLGELSAPDAPIPHEARTARDYAMHLSRQGRVFVYLSYFKGRSVPVFDGLILDWQTNQTLAAVSLKYRPYPVRKVEIQHLVDDISERLRLQREFGQLASPHSWFENVTGRAYANPEAHLQLYWHTRALMNIFKLFQSPERPHPDFNLVIDMRDHGYPFDFVTVPGTLDRILTAVRKKSAQRVRLTLLWDSHRIIEFTPDGHQVFE